MTVNTAKTSNVNIRKIAMTGVLAAIATVLMFLHFQLPFMPSFISLDFSELPALIAAFTLGPVSGVAVCFVKNLVLLSQTITGGVGELSNFIIGSAFVVPAGLIYRHHRNYGGAIVGSVVGALLILLESVHHLPDLHECDADGGYYGHVSGNQSVRAGVVAGAFDL